MIYLTYNDQPSGVYTSQVCDVCRFMNSELNAGLRLIAFISLHDFASNRKKIRTDFPGAWVLPAVPKAKYWRFSALVFALICFLTGERTIIARNIIATQLALFAKMLKLAHVICLDGRGAIAAEWNEYQVVPDESMKRAIAGQEQKAVLNSDFRIAVSSKLIDHWRKTYGYQSDRHVVIPCTLGLGIKPGLPSEAEIEAYRKAQGFSSDDVVLVYSGSTAGWQSFVVLADILGKVLSSDKRYKLLFLAGEDESIRKMKASFPEQVSSKWVKHSEVQQTLLACDYGILYRENSVTNQVASPTKFAEYLSAGLPVIISDHLGDYSDFVRREKCGYVIGPDENVNLTKSGYDQKLHCVKLAELYFTKASNIKQYEILTDFMQNK